MRQFCIPRHVLRLRRLAPSRLCKPPNYFINYKNYKNFYSRDAKNHNEDLGGVCPLRQLHNTGITIKDKSEVEKYIFNKAMSDIDIITIE